MKMYYKIIPVIYCVAFIPWCLHGGQSKTESQNPNVLFIAIDDLKATLGAYGDPVIQTPNMDRIGQSGTVFLNNHCQMAVCGPSRASFLTGKRPDFVKIWDLRTKIRDIRPEIITLPQYFKDNGYKTVGIGKVFDARSVDKGHDQRSWSVPYLEVDKKYYNKKQPPALGHYQDPETRKKAEKYLEEAKEKAEGSRNSYARKRIRPSNESVDVPDNGYFDGAMTEKAMEQLESLAEESQPFFFAVGFKRPHLPFVAPLKYWELYDRDSIPLEPYQRRAEGSPEIAYHDSHELKMYTDIPPHSKYTDETRRTELDFEKQKELVHAYYATVSYIDALVGKLMKTLDRTGLSENTIVVLQTDHGFHLGDHDLWGKDSNFENSTLSPLIISAPGMESGKTRAPTEFVDIFPTLSQLAGLPIPEDLDGESLVPLMEKTRDQIKPYAVSQFPHKDPSIEFHHENTFLGTDLRSRKGSMGYSIRTERYRLTYWMRQGFRSGQSFEPDQVLFKEFYDYQKDPLETKNWLKDPAYEKAISRMETLMREYFRGQETDLRQDLHK